MVEALKTVIKEEKSVSSELSHTTAETHERSHGGLEGRVPH